MKHINKIYNNLQWSITMLMALILVIFSSCDEKPAEVDVKEGERPVYDISSGEPYSAVNLNTKKIHIDPGCRYAVSISEEYYDVTPNAYLDYLVENGYTYCKVCSKDVQDGN